VLSVDCGVYNHLAAEHLKGYSFIGRLSEEEESLVVDMFKTKRYFTYIETKKKSQCEHNDENRHCEEEE